MRIPALCYHRIEPPPGDSQRDLNFVSPSLFSGHLAMLARLGFSGVTVREIVAWQRGEATLPPRPVAITFDDGYQSVVREAIPRLAEHGWRCTVFAVSSRIGGLNVWDAAAPRAVLLDGVALRALHRDGHEIGSHSRHHRRITTLTDAEIVDELTGSRLELESVVGARVTSFAFPYGTHNKRVLAEARASGYHAACTLKRWGNGRRTNPMRLGRMGVGGPLRPWQLAAKVLKMMATPASA